MTPCVRDSFGIERPVLQRRASRLANAETSVVEFLLEAATVETGDAADLERTISFGLVSVPVRMYSATESKELRFHFLHKDDLQPIGYDKVRKDTGEHVDPDDVVRGFEIEKGRYVPIEDEDLDRLDIELTHAIDICDFVDLEEIDPIYFRKAYYLAPQDGRREALPAPRPRAGRDRKGRDREGRDPEQAASGRAARPMTACSSSRPCTTRTRSGSPKVGERQTDGLKKAEVEMAKSLVENLSASSSRSGTTTRTARSCST